MAVAIDLDGGQTPEEHAQAFTALYREFSGPLTAYCRRLTGPDGDPEGLAHEALLRAWESWDHTTGRPFWPWVVTVARRLAVDHFRRATLRANRAHAEMEASTGIRFPEPEEHAERGVEHATARQAFAGLPTTYRRIVQMHHLDGLSYDEIAAHEGTTNEAVRGMLRRGRHALRAAYTRLEAGFPVVFGLGAIRGLRGRLEAWAGRMHGRFGVPTNDVTAAEALKGAVVLALVLTTGGPVAGHPAPRAAHRADTLAVAPDAQAMTGARAGGSSSTVAPTTQAGTAQGHTVPPVPPSPSHIKVPGDDVTTPEQVAFTHLTPSPRSEDGTVFAAGEATEGCRRVTCPVLFRSTDRGATWQRLPGVGYTGGPLLLPPAWPRDPRIFAVGPDAVKASSDDGASFHGITPAGHKAAMSPGFSDGDPHIWVGFLPGWDYDDRDGIVRPVDLWPLPTADYNSFVFAPAWPADRRVVMGSWSASAAGPQQSTVVVCRDGHCPPPVALPGMTGDAPDLTVPDAFTRTGVAFASLGDQLFRTTDGGSTFRPLDLPAQGKVTTLVAGPDDRLFLGLADVTTSGATGGLFVSDDWGSSWSRLGRGTALDGGVTAITPLGHDRLLAGPQGQAGGGLLCSIDAGLTWRPRCA